MKLSEVTPDSEEIAEARRVLANSTDLAKRSNMASMVHWLKVHGGDANADARDSRGAKRQEFLIMHMVIAMRDKKARSTKTTTRVVAAAQQEVSGFYWWGSENMDAEVGSDKAERHPADIQPEYGWRA